MKTFTRLIRRYVLATAGVILLILALGIGFLGWLVWRNGGEERAYYSQNYSQNVASSMVCAEDGTLDFGPGYTAEEWMNGYAWAMVLDGDGNIIWSYQLPQQLSHRYTPSQVAGFARWYLEDYPVTCWVEDYGLFVIAKPVGSVAKYAVSEDPALLKDVIGSFLPAIAVVAGLIVLSCAWFSWRSSRSLQTVASGLDELAQGRTVQLPTSDFTGELAGKLNQTSAQLQKRNAIIARRDNARTSWIAGVSHDIRTPLALILGWAEQLEQDTALPEQARSKAGKICAQSEKIRSLIDDLNLTSKLQYGAQPLRRKLVTAGALLRSIAADFYESPLAEHCELELEQTPQAECAHLEADTALLQRAVENLLNNSVRHNTERVHIRMRAEKTADTLRLTILDDGCGYPPRVLHALYEGSDTEENAPHILGLHVVEQILQAHGGTAVFTQRQPRGARACLTIPLADAEK